MSGIYGIYNRNNDQIDRNDLDDMATSLLHRGNDDQGICIDGIVGIGHQMFHTTPEALHENLPYEDIETGIVISCDARLDNRDELIDLLSIERPNQEIITDSKLILESYKKWGDECPKQLLGDFSFVIWDKKSEKLICVRDHIGVKPFNYYLSDDHFIFASEASAISTVSLIPKKINEGRIADFLINLEGIDKVSTFYENIYRLPPGHRMIVTKDNALISCYWELDPEKELIFDNDEEYIDAFKTIYEDAIEKRLRCNDSEIASMLSGGIDSSSIVAIAKDLYQLKTGEKLSTFSAISNKSEFSQIESDFISFINKDLTNIESNIIEPKHISALNNEINRVASLSEPFDMMVMITAIYLSANQQGYRVVLDGVEGDMISNLPLSYPLFLMKKGQWLTACKEIYGQSKDWYSVNSSFISILIRNLRVLLIPQPLKRIVKKLLQPSLNQQIKGTIIYKDFAEKINICERIKQSESHTSQGMLCSQKEQHINTITNPKLTVALERYDRIAARCGIEPRHPLLDKRLIEFMVAIPWNQKTRNGLHKFLLRKSSERILPKKICWRHGREHVGWDFEKAWIDNNQNQIIKSIKQESKKIRKYLNLNILAEEKAILNKNNDEYINSLRTVHLLLHSKYIK